MKSVLLISVIASILSIPSPVTQKTETADCQSMSRFTIDGRSLSTNRCVVQVTNEFFGGRTDALKILFTTGGATGGAGNATLVLFIDKANKVWQVNLTVVTPGNTVARTVASTPEELKAFASALTYDGKRLQLRHKGSVKESSSTLDWDVSLVSAVRGKVPDE